MERHMTSPERVYKSYRGEHYFNRFPLADRDIAGLCYRMKTRSWIRAKDKVFEYGAGTGRNLVALDVVEKACYDVSEIARMRASSVGLAVYDDATLIP